MSESSSWQDSGCGKVGDGGVGWLAGERVRASLNEGMTFMDRIESVAKL